MAKITEPGSSARAHYVNVWGQRLRVLVNRPEGRPSRTVLVLNGIGVGAEVLDGFVAELDPTAEVIRIDPPGVGGSPGPGLPYLLPQMAWLVEGVLRALHCTRVDVIGYSWGGLVAQQLALQARLPIDRLVLVASNTGLWSIPGDPRAMALMLTPWAGPSALGVIGGGLARTHPQEVMALLGPDLAAAGRGYWAQAAAAMSWTTVPALWAITQPTLVISGEDDPLVPAANARVLAGLIPDSRLHLHPGGHFDVLLLPAALTPVISDFLSADERQG